MSKTATPPAHEQIIEPVYKVLAEFMDKCSDNPETREATVSALIFSYWGQGSRGLQNPLPSAILVNAGEQEHDPVLRGIRSIEKNSVDEKRIAKGYFADKTPEQAPETMLKAALGEQELRKSGIPGAAGQPYWKQLYNDARLAGFGDGRVSYYADAWHKEMGLVTDEKNAITLLLERAEDWKLFRQDLFHRPARLHAPVSMSTDLDLVRKSLCVSGSLPPGEFDEQLVDAALELGQPYFFLPHVTDTAINIPNIPALGFFHSRLDTHAALLPVPNSVLQKDKWCQYYQDWIFERLSRLPRNYRFCVLDIIHQLHDVCKILTQFAGPADGKSTPETLVLVTNLFNCILRSIALSLAFLAWHGLGIELPCSLAQARKLLKLLREDGGSMKLRDVQRATGFGTAAKRDEVLKQLENQGLVTVDGNVVSATYMHEFIANIQGQLPCANKVQPVYSLNLGHCST